MLIEEIITENYSNWDHKESADYSKHLEKTFGAPDEMTDEQTVWHNVDGFKRIVCRDEYILHGSPAPHYDFVYSYIDFKSLNESSKVFSNYNILITSVMLGLVKLNDLIPNYKLKMNVLKLTSFWNPIFTKSLKNEDFILDLLPEVHRKSYSSDRSIKIDFKFLKDNKSVSAGHNGKAIKGKFLRFIAENKLERLEEILKFDEDGFIWNKNAFVKKI